MTTPTSASDERLDSLRRRAREAGTNAVSLIAEAGDELAGNVTVVVVKTLAGARLAWHARGVVAAQRVAECRPRPGDLIVILREPDRVSAAGRKYRSWKVEVDHGLDDLVAGTEVATKGDGDTGRGPMHDPTGEGWDADDEQDWSS